MEKEKVYLVYDGECPVCDNYCTRVRINEHIGELVLVDARKDSEIMKEITEAGFDIDEGMVLKIKDKLYYGSDAINMLSLITTPVGFVNKINYHFFSSKLISDIFYPIGKELRNCALKYLKVDNINNLKKSE